MMQDRSSILFSALMICVFSLFSGCGGEQEEKDVWSSSGPPVTSSLDGMDYGEYAAYYDVDIDNISFLDEAKNQIAPEVGVSELMFTSSSGEQMAVNEYGQGGDIVLVVTRGNTQPICPFCLTQTANYIRNYQEFKDRNAEVVLVYPVREKKNTEKLDGLLESARKKLEQPEKEVPFPVVFDVELTAVDRLGIRKDLSKPATYILDSNGVVRYTYVGAHWGDRPSTELILKELDSLRAADAGSENINKENQEDASLRSFQESSTLAGGAP